MTSSSNQEASVQIYLPKPTIQGNGKQSSLTVDTAAFVSKGNGRSNENPSPPKFINTTGDTLGVATIAQLSNANIKLDKDQLLMTSVQRILNDINA